MEEECMEGTEENAPENKGKEKTGDEEESMAIVPRSSRTTLSSRSGQPGAVAYRRKPTNVVLQRKDGSEFTPWNGDIVEQWRKQNDAFPIITDKQEQDDLNDLLKAIVDEHFLITNEDGTTRMADVTSKEDRDKLNIQRGYSIFEPINDEQEDAYIGKITEEDIECFSPGECVEFTFEQLGLKVGQNRIFPIDPAKLLLSKRLVEKSFEHNVRIPSLLMGCWIKTPYVVQLIEHRPWQLVDFSTNIIRLYGSMMDLLTAGLKYGVDPRVLKKAYFKDAVTKHDLVRRYGEQGFFHFSHYQPYSSSGESPFWDAFPDPFEPKLQTGVIGMTKEEEAMSKEAFRVWYETMMEDWMVNVFPSPDVASNIVYHWWLRMWTLKLYPVHGVKIKNLSIKDTFAHRRRIAQMMVEMAGFTKECLRYTVLSWLYYEYEFALMYEEYTLLETFQGLRNMVLERVGQLDNASVANAPWHYLDAGDETELMQQLYAINTEKTRNVMHIYERYFLSRGGENQDVYTKKWKFLMSTNVTLSEYAPVETLDGGESPPELESMSSQEEGEDTIPPLDLAAKYDGDDSSMETVGNIIMDAPLKDYVIREYGTRSKIYEYRDALCRVAMMKKAMGGIYPKDYDAPHDSMFVNIDVKGHEPLLSFDFEAIHRLKGDGRLLFPDDTFPQDDHMIMRREIPWSPTMYVMRTHWAYLSWRCGTWNNDDLTDKICEEVLPSLLENLPDLHRMRSFASEELRQKVVDVLSKKENERTDAQEKARKRMKRQRSQMRKKRLCSRKSRRR